MTWHVIYRAPFTSHILLSPYYIRAKAKLYCTVTASYEGTRRNILVAFTVYATGSLDRIFSNSLLSSRPLCKLKSLLSGRYVLILILNSSIDLDQLVPFLHFSLWESS